MSQSDFSHAQAELTGTPWVAHLAAGLAASMCLLALIVTTVMVPLYFEPISDEAVALDLPTQVVWRTSNAIDGALSWFVGIAMLCICFGLWRRARARGGASTLALFAIAAFTAGFAVIGVLVSGRPTHQVQDIRGADDSGR